MDMFATLRIRSLTYKMKVVCYKETILKNVITTDSNDKYVDTSLKY